MEYTGRGRWGGIWRAPRHYSLIDETGTQTQVTGTTNNLNYNKNYSSVPGCVSFTTITKR